MTIDKNENVNEDTLGGLGELEEVSLELGSRGAPDPAIERNAKRIGGTTIYGKTKDEFGSLEGELEKNNPELGRTLDDLEVEFFSFDRPVDDLKGDITGRILDGDSFGHQIGTVYDIELTEENGNPLKLGDPLVIDQVARDEGQRLIDSYQDYNAAIKILTKPQPKNPDGTIMNRRERRKADRDSRDRKRGRGYTKSGKAWAVVNKRNKPTKE